jgi:hypothetical protein
LLTSSLGATIGFVQLYHTNYVRIFNEIIFWQIEKNKARAVFKMTGYEFANFFGKVFIEKGKGHNPNFVYPKIVI